MSFQEGALFDSMSVFDNVAFPLRRTRPTGARGRGARARVPGDRAPAQRRERRGRQSSPEACGAESGFARAIAHEPEILLFDEPNTGLDPIMTDIIDEVILEMRENG